MITFVSRTKSLALPLGFALAVLGTRAFSQDGAQIEPVLGSLTGDQVYTPVVPCRFVDGINAADRVGISVPNGTNSRYYRVRGNTSSDFVSQGAAGTAPNGCGIPTSATAIMVNLTVADPDADGDLKVDPADVSAPSSTSALNYTFGSARGKNLANAVIVKLCDLGAGSCASGADPKVPTRDLLVTFHGAVGSTYFLADVLGYFSPATGMVTSVNSISGAVTIAAGSNVTVGSAGNTVTIAATTPTSFSGSLAGEVTGTQSATVVSNAVSTNTASAVVRRDSSGDFSARTVTLDGNLVLPASSGSSQGTIKMGGNRFIHYFGAQNTFVGNLAGNFTLTGDDLIGIGVAALAGNTSGNRNVAIGTFSLNSNTDGYENTATGYGTMTKGTSLHNNAAYGAYALANNTGNYNTANGSGALNSNTSGGSNAGFGNTALFANTTGGNNTAIGANSLQANTTGSSNIALGNQAGTNLTTGSNNIDIANAGVAAESSTIRIGTSGTHTRAFVAGIRGVTTGVADAVSVVIDSNGQLGTSPTPTPANFSGSLAGEVTGTQGATVVSNAVATNTASAIVRRDASGDFASGSVSLAGNLSLVSTTATAGAIMKGANRFIHGFGTSNTFVGDNAGNFTMTAGNNTATGTNALRTNTTGSVNTAGGAHALTKNTTGDNNTGEGALALTENTTGSRNTAGGAQALANNTIGNDNTAAGAAALKFNSTASKNVAIGAGALTNQSFGNAGAEWDSLNTAVGYSALLVNQPTSTTTGANNTAIGGNALINNTTGSNNIAVGTAAGSSLTTGSNNIDIGNGGGAAEANTIRIGTSGTQTRAFVAGIRGVTTGANDAVTVLIDSNGQLGTVSSSRRYKEDIADMGPASDRLMTLRPVTFRYLKPYENGAKPMQFGLIAEEVAQAFPELVVLNKDGQPETVKYQDLTPMLLNEVQKLRRLIEAQTSRLRELERQASEVSVLKEQSARMAAVLERLTLEAATGR